MSDLFNSGIRPAVDNWLLEKSREVRNYGKYWSASQAGYCQRKVIFERLGVPHVSKEDDARKQRVFTSGHIFHEWIQGLTKEAGISITQEVELEDTSLMIRGHFDDLVLIQEGVEVHPDTSSNGPLVNKQHLILYDYKTAHSRSFTYAKDRPMSYYHKMQLGTYMYMLRKGWAEIMGPHSQLLDSKLTEARILSISKDDLRMHEKQLLWTTGLETEILDYWKTLNIWWEKKKIPPCTCADHENGFLANEKYNPYFFEGEPCSMKYYRKWETEKKEAPNAN